MDKTEKLLIRIAELADDAYEYASTTSNNYYESVTAYRDLGSEVGLIGTPSIFYDSTIDRVGDYFESVLEVSAERLEEAHDSLQKLDATLLELIALRGQLAEEIDIPIGGERWLRYETYTM
jgi:hypothetical protein